MNLLIKLFNFFGNLIYLGYMTFIEDKDFDFDLLPFGNKSAYFNWPAGLLQSE